MNFACVPKEVFAFWMWLASLQGCTESTSRLDRQIQARRRELRREGVECRTPSHQRKTPVIPHRFSESTAEEAEPMQIGRTRLSQEEQGR